ncbi:hypothetical protein Taro_044235 [Colocasia esculenta]|uniref:Uncharacterized protein n=1 Tax=Colocasia esculenta TaxID=4460 RepID=A0A843X300_COLES|nr:hypothetical protein [Colocasia esculenta]
MYINKILADPPHPPPNPIPIEPSRFDSGSTGRDPELLVFGGPTRLLRPISKDGRPFAPREVKESLCVEKKDKNRGGEGEGEGEEEEKPDEGGKEEWCRTQNGEDRGWENYNSIEELGYSQPGFCKADQIGPNGIKLGRARFVIRMAPKKGNSEDIGWQHGTALGSRHNYKYNYCDHTRQGGGVSRLKKHLAVKRLMVEYLKDVRVEAVRKRADREMQERIISGRQRDEDDDDEL